MNYLVKFKAHSNKFNEDYIAKQITRDLGKFERNHVIVEAYEVKVGRYNQIKEIGKRVR